jgi:hypothetical protein
VLSISSPAITGSAGATSDCSTAYDNPASDMNTITRPVLACRPARAGGAPEASGAWATTDRAISGLIASRSFPESDICLCSPFGTLRAGGGTPQAFARLLAGCSRTG